MNRLIIIGNLTRDPELRTANTSNGQVTVCAFTVAVNRRRNGSNGQPEADFFRVTAWRQLAENCSKYLAKGRKVAVVGSVSVSTYQGSDGATRASLEVSADDVEFLSPRQDGQQSAQQGGAQQTNWGQYTTPPPQPVQAAAPGPGYVEVDEDELPF